MQLVLEILTSPDPFYKTTSKEENTLIMAYGIQLVKKLRAEKNDPRAIEFQQKLEAEKSAIAQFKESLSKVDKSIEKKFESCIEVIGSKIHESVSRTFESRERENTKTELACMSLQRQLAKLIEQNNTTTSSSKNTETAYSSKTVPAIIGKVNEDVNHRLILNTFSSPDFKMYPKENYSGDHVFSWNSLKIMWEDKNYQAMVPIAEVEKALRDFNIHKDCDVLIMVSLRSPIATHETSTNVDIELVDDRLAIFVSYFNSNSSMEYYVKAVIQSIIMAYRPFLMRRKNGTPDLNLEKLKVMKEVLPKFLQIIVTQEKTIDELIGETRTKLLSIKKSISGVRTSILNMLEEDEEEDEEETASSKKERRCSVCKKLGHDARVHKK